MIFQSDQKYVAKVEKNHQMWKLFERNSHFWNKKSSLCNDDVGKT